MADQLKCGRKVFDLVKGDQVMDNGKCYQLITRMAGSGVDTYHPYVSKPEFKKYMAMNTESVAHHYGYRVTIWEYQGENA